MARVSAQPDYDEPAEIEVNADNAAAVQLFRRGGFTPTSARRISPPGGERVASSRRGSVVSAVRLGGRASVGRLSNRSALETPSAHDYGRSSGSPYPYDYGSCGDVTQSLSAR